MYGEATNPLPFVIASYALGAVLIFGFMAWIFLSRAKLKQHLEALNEDYSKSISKHR